MKKTIILILLSLSVFAQKAFFGTMAKGTSSSSTIDPLEVPVIIVSGQSNAAGQGGVGSGLPAYLQGPLTGFMFDDSNYTGTFTTANYTSATQVGPDVNLGYLYSLQKRPVYVIKYAVGATILSTCCGSVYWRPSTVPGNLYPNLLSVVGAALNNLTLAGFHPSIKGFVWFQGEADSYSTVPQATYQSDEAYFFTQFKADMGLSNLNIYSALVLNITAGSPAVRAAKAVNATTYPGYNLINVDDLNTIDGVHLDINSQIEFARRIFNLLRFN